jgi:hypothetical protein
MASKKNNPAVEKRISDRKAFVKDKVSSKGISAKQARQRFYVQTRLAELKAAGKPVGPEVRKALQKKFQSGDVSRKGFAPPKKKSGSKSTPAPMGPVKKGNSTGGDQPVRVGRGGKQVTPAKTSSKEPRMTETGKYGPWNPKPQPSMFPKGKSKPKGPKDSRGFGQRVVEAEAAKKPVKPKSYPKSVKR